VATLSAEPQFENTLTVEGKGGRTDYRFAVEGELEENYGIGDADSISGKTAEGAVTGGQDSYTFSGDIASFSIETDGEFATYLNGSEVDPETLGETQTTPDADQLPNEVSVRALTNARTEYGIGVSGTLATGDRSNTWSGDNASYEYARGWVSDEGLDNYTFSGEIRTLTDFDSIQIDINREDEEIIITNTGDYEQTGYEIEVSGSLEAYDAGPSSIGGGSATGTVNQGTDVYGFSGDVQKIEIKGAIRVKLQTPYPRMTQNPYPDATVGNLAISSLKHPSEDWIVFTTTVLEDASNMYLARGVSSLDEVPAEIQRVSDSVLVGVNDLEWKDTETVQFWRDAWECTQKMKPTNTFEKPVVQKDQPYPEPGSGGDA